MSYEVSLSRILGTSQQNLLLATIHKLGSAFLRQRGYSWEVRRNGDLKIGLWRKIYKSRPSNSSYPKRFVLIPGFGDTPLSWNATVTLLQPVLRSQFDEIILVDFPGFSGFLAEEKVFPSIDLLLTHLGDTLDSLKPHTIFGHSLGGFLTAHYLSKCGKGERPVTNRLNYSGPERGILACPSGIFVDETQKSVWLSTVKMAGMVGLPAFRNHLFAKEPLWFPLIASAYHRFLKREDVIQFAQSYRDHLAVESVLGQIRSEVCLIWGEKDSLTPANALPNWLESLNKSCNGVVLKNCGHSIHFEAPAVTATILAQLLLGRRPSERGGRWWKVISKG